MSHRKLNSQVKGKIKMIHRDKLGRFCSKKSAAKKTTKKTTKKVAKKTAAKTSKKTTKKFR